MTTEKRGLLLGQNSTLLFYKKFVCGQSQESNFAGTKFACCLVKGHNGKHDVEPIWEIIRSIRFVQKMGLFDLIQKRDAELAQRLIRARDELLWYGQKVELNKIISELKASGKKK